jgi:tetratricopeptide (TPR) repeat protein
MDSVLERLRAALAPGIAVEREIARGGMGVVLLGHDTLLDRPVAIKLLKPELTTAIAAERFLREARHAAGLRHPNVVRVHHAGEADGLLYYTMDYITGETLAARLERGRLPPREVVRLGLDVLAALEAAHRHNLIHRDVKPSNIFLGRDRALLGDFGVAYALDASSTALTQPGQPVGTLAYISPEQLRESAVTERTDIYAVGLVLYEAVTGRRWHPVSDPARGDWSRVPAYLREPIRRALQLEPEDRWQSAGPFAQALASAEPRSRPRLRMVSIASAAVAGLLLATYAPWKDTDHEPEIARDLAVFPFATVGLADSSMGPRLAALTGWSLEHFQDLSLTPRQIAFRAWRGSTLLPARRLAALTGERTRSRYGAWGVVRPRGERLEVRLSVVGAAGEPAFEGTVTGDSADPAALGDSVARAITRAVFSRSDPRFRKADALSRVPPEALNQFLLGEEAFARDAWLTAERHYLRAFQLDSSFVLAGWRLGNARRWLPLRTDPPYPPGLFELFQANREGVPAVDRHLIEAQYQPSGAARFERYERAMEVAGDDPYAPLLYGDELFHRGPLAGRPLRDAIPLLERAVATDSTLAPAWEHLAWALIRLGERERSDVALSHLERLAARAEESEIHLPTFLRMAHAFRFGDPEGQSEVMGTLSQSPEALALAARGALSFDLPGAQAALGAALAASGETAGQKASGHVARGIALIALGRPAAGLAAFDSAIALFPHPREARLQAAEWRVILPAVGAAGVGESERERGRAALLLMTKETLIGTRAAWALALDAYARRDTAAARVWGEGVRASGREAGLALLLTGMDHAARRDWQAALAATEPALAFDSAGHAPDPFLRAALHLTRGEWLERLGRPADADRAWLWYENLDVQGWPSAEAQPAEVDWALATHARSRRARLSFERGDRAEGCALAGRVAEIWATAEAAVAAVARDLAALARGCPR